MTTALDSFPPTRSSNRSASDNCNHISADDASVFGSEAWDGFASNDSNFYRCPEDNPATAIDPTGLGAIKTPASSYFPPPSDLVNSVVNDLSTGDWSGATMDHFDPFQFNATPNIGTADQMAIGAQRAAYNPSQFNSGSLIINSAGSATVGSGVTASVSNPSTLELAGSVSALDGYGAINLDSLPPYIPPDRSSPLRVAVTANLYLFGLNDVARDHPQPFSGGRSASQVIIENSIEEGAIRIWDEQANSPNPPSIRLPNGTANPGVVFYNKAERDALDFFSQMRDQNKLDVLIGAPDSGSAAEQLAALSASGQSVGLLYLHGHGSSGDLSVGPNWKFGEGLSATIKYGQTTVTGLSMLDGIKWAPGATIVLAGCDVGEGKQGQALVWAISQYTGQRVVAWKEHSRMGPSGPYGIDENFQIINKPDVDSNHMVDGRTINE